MSGRAIAIGLAAAFAARSAHAAPGADPTSGRAVFTGASVENTTSLELNPAALGFGIANEVFAAASSVIDTISVKRKQLDLATGALSDGAHVHDTEIGPGAAAGVIWHALDYVTLGATIEAPPSEEFPANNTALGYHTLGGYQRDVKIAAGFGFKVNNRFHFGFSITFDNAHLALHYLRDTALDHGSAGIQCGGAACGVENPLAAERYDIDVNQSVSFKDGYIVNFGFVTQLVQGVYFAAAYHSPPGGTIQTSLAGTATVTGAPRDGGKVTTGDATVYLSYPASIDGEVRARLRPDVDLHIGGRWIDLSRESGYDVRVYGLPLAGLGYPEWQLRARDLHDPIAMWGGVEQVDTGYERVRLGARIGFESSSVNASATSPMTIAPASLTLDLGGQLRISKALMVQVTYGLQYFPTVTVGSDSAFDPRARIACTDSGFDYDSAACASVRNGLGIPTAAGEYNKVEQAVRIGVRYFFGK